MNNRRPAVHGFDNAIGGSDRIPPGRWIYVGGTADPGWTVESPPFQNGWSNAGGGLRRLRFRLTNEDQVEIEGSVTGGTAGTVVTTLPDINAVFRDSVLWPAETTYAVGANGDTSVAVWKLEADGDLVYVGEVGGTVGGIVYDTPNVGGSLNVETNAGSIELDSSQDLNLYAVDLVDIQGTDVQIIASNSAAFQMPVLSIDGDVTVNLAVGQAVTVTDGAADVFRIDRDGTVHMKAGASILYDL